MTPNQQPTLQHKLVAIMFTDIVGYTSLMGSDEGKALEILKESRKIQQNLIAKYEGRWLKEMGDGVLAEFNSAYQSVRCAIEIQHRIANTLEVQLRIGVHLGDVTVENNDIFGDGVNIASRIESIADPGAIYLSGSIQNAVRSKADIDLLYLGEVQLKNVNSLIPLYCVEGDSLTVPTKERIKEITVRKSNKRPLVFAIAVFILALVAIYWFGYRASFTRGDKVESIELIAVMPFSNTKPNAETDYLGFAIANEIIGDLVYLKNISVRPSSSVRKYQKQIVDPAKIADELEVDYVLTGNYLNELNIIRLDVELIEASTNKLILREQFQVDFDNAFELQDIVATKVVERLNVQFTSKELRRIEKDIPKNPLAYEYYLRGISYPRSNAEDQLAIDMLNKAIELDSTYAPAYDQLGYRLNGLALFGILDPEAINRVESYFKKALSLNSELLSALVNLSMLYVETARTEEAVEIIRQVLDINPNSAGAHYSLGYIYRYSGMLSESALEMERALSIEPKNTSFRSIGVTYMNMGNYEKALMAFDGNKTSAYTLAWQASIYARDGKYKEAIRDYNRIIAMDTEKLFTQMAIANKASLEGNIDEGLIAIRELEKADVSDAEAWYYFGTTYAILGDKDGAVRCLQRAVDGGYFNYPFMLSDPLLDPMRGDPDLQLVIQKAKEEHLSFKERLFLSNQAIE